MNAKNNGKNKRKAATARELQFLLILRSGERDRIDRMIDGIREKLDRLGEEAWVPE